MVVQQKDGVWRVSRLELKHNHKLTPQGEARFIRSHKHMMEQQKKLIKTFNAVKIPNRKIMAIITFLRGSLLVVSFTKKDASNLRTQIRKQASQNDMMQLLDYFSRKQAQDQMFYYTSDTDEYNTVQNIFWSEGRCRRLYDQYGDCVSFDTTYETNKYNLPFAPFMGITGHGENCLFGCAFLQDETIATFTRLFKAFVVCMGGKAPQTIITDQDIAMKVAVAKIFPQTIHRNCLFHILKKAKEKAGKCLQSKTDMSWFLSGLAMC